MNYINTKMQISEFREKFRNVDVYVIDEIIRTLSDNNCLSENGEMFKDYFAEKYIGDE